MPTTLPNRPPRSALYPNAAMFFALALLVAFAGFYPSYFARLPQTDLAHHFHGASATAWLLLLILQAWLMRTRRIVLHRRVGRGSIVVAAAFIVSGALMIRTMLQGGNPFAQRYGVSLAFLDVTTTLYFALAYGLALQYRRTVELHARFMASTALLVLPPALSRLFANTVPGIDTFEQALNGAYFAAEAVALALVLQDARGGRIHAPYPMLLALLLAQHALVFRVADAGWWLEAAAWIRGLPVGAQ